MKIRPLSNRLIIKRLEGNETSEGGIIIPDTAKEKPLQGKAVAVGPGKKNNEGAVTPIDVNVGEKVLFSRYSGTEIKLDGEELLIMREDDILGIIED